MNKTIDSVIETGHGYGCIRLLKAVIETATWRNPEDIINQRSSKNHRKTILHAAFELKTLEALVFNEGLRYLLDRGADISLRIKLDLLRDSNQKGSGKVDANVLPVHMLFLANKSAEDQITLWELFQEPLDNEEVFEALRLSRKCCEAKEASISFPNDFVFDDHVTDVERSVFRCYLERISTDGSVISKQSKEAMAFMIKEHLKLAVLLKDDDSVFRLLRHYFDLPTNYRGQVIVQHQGQHSLLRMALGLSSCCGFAIANKLLSIGVEVEVEGEQEVGDVENGQIKNNSLVALAVQTASDAGDVSSVQQVLRKLLERGGDIKSALNAVDAVASVPLLLVIIDFKRSYGIPDSNIGDAIVNDDPAKAGKESLLHSLLKESLFHTTLRFYLAFVLTAGLDPMRPAEDANGNKILPIHAAANVQSFYDTSSSKPSNYYGQDRINDYFHTLTKNYSLDGKSEEEKVEKNISGNAGRNLRAPLFCLRKSLSYSTFSVQKQTKVPKYFLFFRSNLFVNISFLLFMLRITMLFIACSTTGIVSISRPRLTSFTERRTRATTATSTRGRLSTGLRI